MGRASRRPAGRRRAGRRRRGPRRRPAPRRPAPVRRERPARRRIPGVLDGDHVTRCEQHPGDQVDRLLAAAGDEHVLGALPAPPRETPTCRAIAARSAGTPAAPMWRRRPTAAGRSCSADERPPGREREAARVGDSGAEVEVGGEVAHHEGLVQAVPDRTRTQRRGGRPRVRVRVGRGADERARPDPAGRSPRRSAGRRPRHRGPRHRQPPCQLPGRRQPRPGAPALPRSRPGSGRTSWWAGPPDRRG